MLLLALALALLAPFPFPGVTAAWHPRVNERYADLLFDDELQLERGAGAGVALDFVQT